MAFLISDLSPHFHSEAPCPVTTSCSKWSLVWQRRLIQNNEAFLSFLVNYDEMNVSTQKTRRFCSCKCTSVNELQIHWAGVEQVLLTPRVLPPALLLFGDVSAAFGSTRLYLKDFICGCNAANSICPSASYQGDLEPLPKIWFSSLAVVIRVLQGLILNNPAKYWKRAVVWHRLLQAAASPHPRDALLQVLLCCWAG